MPKIIDSSDLDRYSSSSRSTTKLFGRERSLHTILGGGKVADIILWKNKRLSAASLASVTMIWFLFEVLEYKFLTLLCNISIIIMLSVFIRTRAPFIFGGPSKIPDIILSESQFKEVALAFHSKLKKSISFLHDIATGKDLKQFLLGIALLGMLSLVGTTVGSQSSSISLLYFIFVAVQTLLALYERYGDEMDYLAEKGSRKLKKAYKHIPKYQRDQ